MPLALEYEHADLRNVRRLHRMVALVSTGVGVLSMMDQVGRLRRAWGYVFDSATPVNLLSPDALRIYLGIAVLAMGVATLLAVAGLALMWRPLLGMWLHSLYVKTMLLTAIPLAWMIAAFTGADPAAPGELVLLSFLLNCAWYAAYPILVSLILFPRVRRVLADIFDGDR